MKFEYSFEKTNKKKYESIFKSENQLLLILAFSVFFIPIILNHVQFQNQIIIGSIVNFFLASSAMYLSFKKSLPVILLPAVGAVISGIIFSSFTLFLVYLMPFIWIGNALFVYFIKNFNLVNKINYFVSVITAGIIKSVFIFSATLFLVFLGIVPAVFLVPMGLIQFITASIGGSLAFAGKTIKK